MREAYNYYVSKVLDAMVASGIPLTRAKELCRKKINKLERCYYKLESFEVAAQRMTKR